MSLFAIQDCEKGEARLFHKAAKFYEGLGERLAATGHTLDVFAAALDQVGLAELRAAVSDSGACCFACSLLTILDLASVPALS